MLSFHHLFTSALIKADGNHPLLYNLPFASQGRAGEIHISKADFIERRLSLIDGKLLLILLYRSSWSSGILTKPAVLSNMRRSIERNDSSSEGDGVQLRRQYSQLVKQLMSSMKINYQALQHNQSDEHVSYVSFVHSVVGLLQQHTTDIAPVDRFFIDSIAFPLPATDPTYVVGRLRNYGLRLSTSRGSRIHKQLATFFQAISERAAVDDQQALLVRQIEGAISDTFESGEGGKVTTLRGFLAEAIFPAYIESALMTDTGWIMGRPVLEVTAQLFTRLLEDVDATSEPSLLAALSIGTSLLASFDRATTHVIDRPMLLRAASTLSTLTLICEAVTAALPVLDYLHRTCVFTFPTSSRPAALADAALECVERFSSCALWVEGGLSRGGDDVLPRDSPGDALTILEDASSSHDCAETKAFVKTNLAETISKEWVRHDGRYYLLRGSIRREVRHSLRDVEVEKRDLMSVLTEFHRMMTRLGFASALQRT